MSFFNKNKDNAQKAIDMEKAALDAGMEELENGAGAEVAGGGMFDDVPTVIEHSYNDADKDRY